MGAVRGASQPPGTPASESRVSRAAQGIPKAVWTALSWDTVAADELGAWAAGAPTRLTAPVAGVYACGFSAVWTADASNESDRRSRILVNGVDTGSGYSQPAWSRDLGPKHAAELATYLPAGAYVEVQVHQNTVTNPVNVQAIGWLVGPL